MDGYFDFIWWEQLRADVELEPLPIGSGEVIAQLLRADGADIEVPEGREVAMRRLVDLELVEVEPPEWDDAEETFRPNGFFWGIVSRGLLDQLPGANA